MSKAKGPTLTTSAGIPVADNQNSLTAGPRGPLINDKDERSWVKFHFRGASRRRCRF
jgi:catalase